MSNYFDQKLNTYKFQQPILHNNEMNGVEISTQQSTEVEIGDTPVFIVNDISKINIITYLIYVDTTVIFNTINTFEFKPNDVVQLTNNLSNSYINLKIINNNGSAINGIITCVIISFGGEILDFTDTCIVTLKIL